MGLGMEGMMAIHQLINDRHDIPIGMLNGISSSRMVAINWDR